jgi:hypothetical protein
VTPQYILRKSLCREAHCSGGPHRLRYAESEIETLGYATEYAEPGYDNPKSGILFANWNHFPGKATDLLERAGYAVEWSDEWHICDGCGKAVRTSPDSYGWQAAYILNDDSKILCLDCVDWAEYLESIENTPRAAVPSTCNPADFGYTRIQDGFENGLHPGQNDDPATILAGLRATGHRHVVFRISGVGQFDVGFEAWDRTSPEE